MSFNMYQVKPQDIKEKFQDVEFHDNTIEDDITRKNIDKVIALMNTDKDRSFVVSMIDFYREQAEKYLCVKYSNSLYLIQNCDYINENDLINMNAIQEEIKRQLDRKVETVEIYDMMIMVEVANKTRRKDKKPLYRIVRVDNSRITIRDW